MKKIIALLLALMMVLCCFAACDFDLPFGDDDDEKEEVKGNKKDDDDEDEDEDDKDSSDKSDYDYEEALERVIKSKKGDFKAYWACYPDEIWDATEVDKDDMEDQFNEDYDNTVDYAGEVVDVKFDISDEEKMDDDDIADLIDNINDSYYCDLDADDVSKAYEFEAEITIEYEDQNASVDGDYYAIKYDGEWYIVTEYYGFYA